MRKIQTDKSKVQSQTSKHKPQKAICKNQMEKQTDKSIAEKQICNNIDSEPDEGCKVITFAQQRKILKEIDDIKYRNFFWFCCCTGTRVCEALSIKTADIDKAKNLIKIKMCDSKTKKHRRTIPYLPELFENMDLKKKYLFDDISDDGSKQYFYKLYQNLKFDLSRHSSRHTFISICSFIGIEPQTIQQWAGHTSLKMTTDTYTHVLRKGTSPILEYLKKLKQSLKN